MRRMFLSLAAMALGVLAMPQPSTAAEIRYDGCDIVHSTILTPLADAFKAKTGHQLTMHFGGDGAGIKALTNRSADIGGLCRHLLETPEEKDLVMVPVAWDAVVVVVHPSNPVANLTRDQLTKIFSGKTKKWSDVGAPASLGDIHVYVRQGKKSGVGLMAREIVFRNLDMDFPQDHVKDSSTPLELAIEKDPAGIGFTGITSAVIRKLKMVKFEGVMPSDASMKDGSYEVIRPLYLTFARASAGRGVVGEFVRFALSKEGQGIIGKAGILPITDSSEVLWARYYHVLEESKQDIAALKQARKSAESMSD
ncbi:MAG: substrate-binding domain-containing protein [Myxococcota bacterium]